MRALIQDRYGDPQVLRLLEVDRPHPGPGQVLVRVQSASVNALDWYRLRGRPLLVRLEGGVFRPRGLVRGVDLAGTVEALGEGVTGVRPGDEVFGVGSGTFAEYALASPRRIAPKPPALTFDQAAAVPVAGATALLALREEGGLRPGQRVFVHGAGGGVGTFVVQLAKALGGRVTAATSGGFVDSVRRLGADEVLDYAREDVTRRPGGFDLVVDLGGSRPRSALRRLLARDGRLVVVGGTGMGPLLGALLASRLGSRRTRTFFASVTTELLRTLAEYMGTGAVAPVIGRTVALPDVPDALREIGTRHARGKTVVRVA